jgi:hypothetical protein
MTERLMVNAFFYLDRACHERTGFNVLRIAQGDVVSRCGHNHKSRELAEKCMARELRRWARTP